MKAYIFLLTLLVLLPSGYLYAGDKVYTDDDLGKYKSGNEESTYQYNQKVMQRERRELEPQEAEKEYIEEQRTAIDEQNKRKAEKEVSQKRIDKLEKEKAQEEIDRMHELKVGGFVGKRRAEDRKERAIQREQELEGAYRDAGLSRERELQKRTSEAEAKKKEAEERAEEAESRASQAEQSSFNSNSAPTPQIFYDIKSRTTKTCSGGVCY